jgi:hypothetical protein
MDYFISIIEYIKKRHPALLVILFFSVSLIIFGLTIMANEIIMMNWPVTKGKIIYADIEETVFQNNDGRPSSNRYYKLVVKYNYLIKGNEFSGKYTGSDTDFDNAVKASGKYKLGQSVDIHYNPANPGKSSLNPGFRIEILYLLIAGFLGPVVLTIKYFIHHQITKSIINAIPENIRNKKIF